MGMTHRQQIARHCLQKEGGYCSSFDMRFGLCVFVWKNTQMKKKLIYPTNSDTIIRFIRSDGGEKAVSSVQRV